MTLEQAQDCQEIVHWCNGNVRKMQEDGKTHEEISQACLNSICPHIEESCIDPNVIHRYVGVCLS